MSDDEESVDENPFHNEDELRDDFLDKFTYLENVINYPEHLPEIVGYFIAEVQFSYFSTMMSDRYRDSICTFRHCRDEAREPEISFLPASQGIRLTRDMDSWEREEQRRFFKSLRQSTDPARRKLWFEIIRKYKEHFLADFLRTSRMRYIGDPGCSHWPTPAEQIDEGLPGSSRGQSSAQQFDLSQPGTSRGSSSAQQFDLGQPGTSRGSSSAQQFDLGHPGTSRGSSSAQQFDLGQPGTSRGSSSTQQSSTGLSGSPRGLFSDLQSSTTQPGSSRGQLSTEQSSAGTSGSQRGPFSDPRPGTSQPGSSRGQSSTERESFHAAHQERIPSADTGLRLLGDAFSPLGEDALVESLEYAVRSTPSSSDRGAEARDYGREITSERWRGNVQRVASAESPPLRPGSRTAPEVSLSPDLVIRPNDILTPEERERMLNSNDDIRAYHRRLDKEGREAKDKCSRWLSSQGINPSSWGEPGPSSSSSYSPSRTTKPGERKRSKEPDPKDQPGPSGAPRSSLSSAKRQKMPSKGTSPEDDSDPKPSDDSE